MARVRSVDFLPEIFQTDANRQFLAATLDQLTQEPKFKKTQGYIGRTVGPGVDPADRYVVEPTKTRTNYQLEPGVISLDPDNTKKIKNSITYPGMLDAFAMQGANSDRPDRMFQNEYYSWDPFVDLDSFVNFSQYYWVKNGPAPVSVTATGVPLQQTFVVNRSSDAYTFDGIAGTLPTLDVVRGGNYQFQLSQNPKQTVTLRVTRTNVTSYNIDQVPNQSLTLVRGNTYLFSLSVDGDFPLWIKTAPTTGLGDQYNTGVTRNGSAIGNVTFTVPQNAPDTLYYQCQNQSLMGGTITVVDGEPGSGPKFWIQTDPGISGRNPVTPNISTRQVLGVTNNGIDLGTIEFNVPTKNAQDFFYNLNDVGTVDLVTDLKFDQIDGVKLSDFIADYGGIDGITSLNSRTLIFANDITDPVAGGWFYGNGDPVDPAQYFSIWRIQYTTVGSDIYLSLGSVVSLPQLSVITVLYGTTYSSTSWYKTLSDLLDQVPVLSAQQDILYYQDSVNPNMFGQIRVLDPGDASTLYIDGILGQKTYTSPNGVVFSNGLKVQFPTVTNTGLPCNVVPASYATRTTTVNCISTAAGLNLITCDSTANLIVGQTVTFSGNVFGGVSDTVTYWVRSIFSTSQFTISTVKNGPAVTLTSAFGTMTATAVQNKQYYVSGVGTSIELLDLDNFYLPETSVETYTSNSHPDYLTIDRASKDLNAWSRSNCWFHIDVLTATGKYNSTSVDLNNNLRAKRPILQFRPGIRLFDMGTDGKTPVDIIDFRETDALSNIEGSTGYTVYSLPVTAPQMRLGYVYEIISLGNTDWNIIAGTNGVVYNIGDTITVVAAGTGTGKGKSPIALANGMRVVFAADEDANVRDKIYIVNFITPDTVPPLIAQPIIHLELALDGEVLPNQNTVVLQGEQKGRSFWYDGSVWQLAQTKTAVQQAPLFNVYDAQGVSYSVKSKYPSSNFVGSKLFSYALGLGLVDPVLQFKLQYLTLQNVGDIVFENNLYKDTFDYVSNNTGVTQPISEGFPYEYQSRTQYTRLLGWQTAPVQSRSPQQFRFTFDGLPLKLDVRALLNSETVLPAIKVFVNNQFQDPGTYTVVRTDKTTSITFNTAPVLESVCEVLVLSDQVSEVGFYQVATNLDQNPLNQNSKTFTLGTIRNHYESICENLTTLSGPINGANNTRDLGNILPYGQIILQQSAPLTLAGYFARSEEYNIFAALEFNSREYQKFKNQLMEAVTQQNIGYSTTAEVLDSAVAAVTIGRVQDQSFYWSDMLPTGSQFISTSYTVTPITIPVFDTVQVYNYTSANYLGMNVYLNDTILTRDRDYVVATNGPRITVLVDLVVGDVITLHEYAETYGNFVPNTPSKMGLYPLWRPAIVEVATTSGTKTVILGHDGSETPIFGDIRDDVLLEFETRIFNNCKLDGNPVPLDIVDVLPGQFRKTGFAWQEINDLLAQNLLTYVGWNKLDYTKQDYNYSNSFSYNYSNAQNRLDDQYLLGAWRGIYRYFYDTQQPELTPWEMLGFAIKPDWWEEAYSNGPWTGNNLNLWGDLELGLVRDPAGEYILPQYARPGLTKVIPTGDEGALLSPLDSVTGVYDNYQWQKSWKVGDGGPVEASWWNSSDYPFAVMRLLALTRPAKFFALFADRDLYKFNTEFEQYLYNERYRLDANNLQLYGDGTSKASYINWIIDYNKILGTSTTTQLERDLANLDVRLCYRMASFSDKQYIKLYVEKSSPNTLNNSLLIPDENYQLLVYKNQPFDRATYSSVVIQVVEDGWAVYGYSTVRPYFEIRNSQVGGVYKTFSVAGTSVQVPTFYSDQTSLVPYGFVYSTRASVADFLLSYGKMLESEGLTFTNRANGYILDWDQMVQEFLYWSQQGWAPGSLINLNPLAESLDIAKPLSIVDTINVRTVENSVLDQNKRELPTRNLNIVRLENNFKMQPLVDSSISYADLKFTSYESMIVLDNVSLFGDLIFDPTTGARQSRLNLTAFTSTEWNGTVDAQGFILNQDNVPEWNGLRIYPKGEVVKYKNNYWSAATIVQPSAEFNYNDWYQSDYTQIELGLLPNIANKANQLANSYNINSANLESDNDLLSYGLIGYRPRQYFAALNLDDVSQINIYRQFLATKGTLQSVQLLGQARLNKEVADYTVYENWAVLRSTYGANASRSYIDLRLNRALLNSNPSLVQITNPGQASEADQSVVIGSVWKASFAVSNPDVFPTVTTSITDTALPTAGYVNFADADITVFDINNPASLGANLDTIKVGTSIWVAKVNSYDWNIYRAQNIPGNISHVCENLDGTCLVRFTQPHGLKRFDFLIIRFMDTEVDGVYRVTQVLDPNSVNIVLNLAGNRTVVNGNGIGFTLQTMRVAQASDVLNLPYSKELAPGAKVWVDNNGSDQWSVFEKQDPFTEIKTLSPLLLDATEAYGAAVAQTNDRSALFVGSPRYGFANGTEKGAVYFYVKSISEQYEPISPLGNTDNIFTLDVTGARGFGNAIAAGTNRFAVAGASASLGPAGQANNGYACVMYRDPTLGFFGTSPWTELQLLTLPTTTPSYTPGAGEFGYSVAMSLDEQWIYVGAPGLNKVYAYGLVQWQDQGVAFVSDGVQIIVDIGNRILIDNANQLTVTQNGRKLVLGVDYTVSASFNTVIFTVPAPAGAVIRINRNYIYALGGNSVTASFNVINYLYGVTDIYSVSVLVDNVLQRPNIDYTFDGTNVVFEAGSIPPSGTTINFYRRWYYTLVDTITVAGLGASDRFGHSVTCTTDGRQVMIGCPYSTQSGLTEAGAVYVFDRNVQKFIYGTDPSSVSFTVLGAVTEPVSVLVNNQPLINADNATADAPNSFTVSGNTITVNTDLIVGDVIEIETNQFVQQQKITQHAVEQFSNFGQAVDICVYNCSLYTGAPQSSYTNFKGGVVERDVNQSRVYGSIQSLNVNPTLTVGHTLRVNNVDCVVPAATSSVSSLQGLANNISANAPNATATVANGLLTITVTDSAAAPVGNKLQVAPGSVGTAFSNLGFSTFYYTQTIESPYPVDFAAFGASLAINDTAENLVVGAPKGSLYLILEFDVDPVTGNATTIFDADATEFYTLLVQSGAVYTYDYLPAASSSLINPGAFVFGQQIVNDGIATYDQFGQAVSYTAGILVATAPGHDFNDSQAGFGVAYVYENPDRKPAWTVLYHQQPVVDIRSISSAYLYDRITSAKTEFFDFFDPLQGKILGAAAQNIDYIGAIDPAQYNVGSFNNNGQTWAQSRQGEIWWDISTVRFIDPNQDSIVYASRRWAQVFPGSSVDVYQWIQSAVPPANYAGPGVPYSIDRYTVNTRLNVSGTFTTEYYFWVRGITTADSQQGKTLSVATIANYISDPKASGIAYIAPIDASTIAIYNAQDYIVASDTILSVEFDQVATDANVHQEYELIAQGRADAFLSDNLYRKLQDSFCGVDRFGNLVPDPNLSPAQRYGVSYRPRQSMFVNRFLALKNYIQRVNAILSRYEISETRSFNLLDSQEPVPPSTITVNSVVEVIWNLQVANLEILDYQNIYAVPLGYKYLVLTDSNNRGLWTIYTVISDIFGVRSLELARVQNFKTSDYWSYVNWYKPGYNPSTKVLYTVPNYASLATLSAPVGTSAKVSANAQGKFEIYLLTELGWERVGLQDGTIAIDATIYDYALGRYGFDVEVFDAQYFDQEPVIETRKIIQAINEDLLIGDLLTERNQCLTLMFDFVLSEQLAPQWLIKTSLIDVDHRIRQLIPFQNYIRDNQDFVSDYLQEVKPYHVQVREFNLRYDGNDLYQGAMTDFDVPAYYDTDLVPNQYVSPILLPYTHSAYQPFNIVSDVESTDPVWAEWPYSQWYGHFTLTLSSVRIVDEGTGYTEAPQVVIETADGDSGSGAAAIAFVTNGSVSSVLVTNPGAGYTVTPRVIFDGGNGTLARAYAVMNERQPQDVTASVYNVVPAVSQTQWQTQSGRTLVPNTPRTFKTVIKYDRYQYNTSIETWSSDGSYLNGTLVRYDNRVWRATSQDDSSAVTGPDFDLANWTLVPAAELSGVNRTMGFYTPGVNEPGLDIHQLISGTSYPGVQVWGDYFLGSNVTPLTILCTSSSATNNAITCNSTLKFTVYGPIRFIGTTFGGIVAGTVYYVKEILSSTQFTVSTIAGGSTLALSNGSGSMLAWISEPVDAVYASSFTDQYLGLRPTDINVDGGQFIGPYEGHAPEELVNGSEYDTVDIRVYTRPGSDWTLDGHGFQFSSRNFIYQTDIANYSWADILENPAEVIVFNATTGLNFTVNIDYTIDWDDQTITILTGASNDDVISITVYEIGGGSQLYRNTYTGSLAGSSVIVPVNAAEIYEIPVFNNGVFVSGVTWEPYTSNTVWDITQTYAKQHIVTDSGNFYRALQTVPPGIEIDDLEYWFEFVPTLQSKINFGTTFGLNDSISLVVMGVQTPQNSWSTAQTQTFIADDTIVNTMILNCVNSLGGTNPANIIVNRNGSRLRPAAGIEWIGDDTSVEFGLPQRMGFDQDIIDAYTEISVWVDNELQIQSFGSIVGDYAVTNWTGSNTPGRQVLFATPPAAGAKILISVSTQSQYTVLSNNRVDLSVTINLGDVFTVTSWNDTSEQDLATLVYVGPVVTGITVFEGFDSVPFDAATLNNAPGSFDYSQGIAIANNYFYIRPGQPANRLWVTLNGLRLLEGQDFTVQNDQLILNSGPIATNDVMVITEFAQDVVPEAMAFRIFQDMRGIQTTYRITANTSTTLAQPLLSDDDIAFVVDASALSEPNLELGYFGVITINGERILYRERNLGNNSLTGLQRGTAGTGASDHAVSAEVYDMGIGNRMPDEDQNYIVSNTATGNGVTTVFTAPDLGISNFGDSSTIFAESIEVYVGGIRSRLGMLASQVTVGNTYVIANLGNTDWYAMGLPADQYPAPGVEFTVTAAGIGTGVVGESFSTHYYQITDWDPVAVQFLTGDDLPAPAEGVEVTILERRGVNWYQPGIDTASNGQPLQTTQTEQARFLRGE
jgi:hypothetical protein